MISKYKSEHLLWTRTAANASSGPEQLQMLQELQMLQLRKQGVLHHKEGILRTHKVNSCFGREQLQMLHVAHAEQLKQYRRQSHCIIKKGIFTPSYEPTKRTAAAKARAASRHVGQCNARVPACCSVQYVQCQYSTVQEGSLFLNERTGLHKKSVF